ncbi:MAG: phosphopantetheine-binding protein [Treponema sp.]|jgi:acyl carrier protein|nr:phosphopantetheine-binding protein [Treponema sp.]
MTKEAVFEKLKDILVEYFELDPEVVQPEAQLLADLDMDSIDAVDLIVKMKQYIPGKIDPEQFKTARTVQDVVEILFPLMQQMQ